MSVYEGTHLFHTSNPDMDMIEPLDRLRLAIIHRAVLDWEKLLHGKAWEGNYNYGNDTKYNFTEIRAFFNSGWCEMLVPNTDSFKPSVMLEILEKRLKRAKEESLCPQ